jgi:hypothetical protein
MFKTLYRCARTAARHENGPAAKSRLAYLEHLAAGSATLHALRARAGVLFRAAVHMNLDDISPVKQEAVEEAARAWAHRPYLNTMAKGTYRIGREFRMFTCSWLHHAGRLLEKGGPPTPHQAEIDAYCCYMTEERGLAKATVTTTQRELPKFFRYTAGKTLEQMRLADLEGFLAHLGKLGWTRCGIIAWRISYTDRSPVPVRHAKEPVPFVPYIYTREELKRLLDGVTSYQKKWFFSSTISISTTSSSASTAS